MWLLRAKDATLEHFVSPEHVPPKWNIWGETYRGYAILSHVWGKDEQTFQDVQALPSKCASGQTPRDIASEKIRKACELAEKKGYQWIWIDTCCIDKSSSAELSEAINSMFRYYSLAGVCLAYLEDVSDDDGSIPEHEFKKSKWHTRGWTLQELIAPKWVAFVSSSWKVIGYKDSHTELVEEATGVPVEVLNNPKQMKKFSIAQRMSWAARRVTTREEDEAYCLLGIFDINMPTLYGEGRKAFRRLQEEIMRQSPDTTLFAWGAPCTWDELVHLRVGHSASFKDPGYRLFATSPSAFRTCSQLRFVDPTKCLKQSSETEQHDGYITFTSTPHGVLATIPTLIYQEQRLGHLGWVEDRSYLLLPLRPISSQNILSKDKLYTAGTPLRDLRIVDTRTTHSPHVVYAPTSMNNSMWQKSAVANWTKIYLAYQDVTATTNLTDDVSAFQSEFQVRPSFHHYYSPFHFDLRHLGRGKDVLSSHVYTSRKYSILPEPGITWRGDPPMVLAFVLGRLLDPGRRLYIHLGTRCKSVARPPQVVHWAHMHLTTEYPIAAYIPMPKEIAHDCSRDHISDWPEFSRRFGYGTGCGLNYQITLSFTKFEWDPQRSLVLHLDMKRVVRFDNKCDILDDENPSSRSQSSKYSAMPIASRLSGERLDTVKENPDDGGDTNSDAVPAQPSAAVEEPVAPSSTVVPQTYSPAQGPGRVEGMQPGTKIHKRGHVKRREPRTAPMKLEKGILSGSSLSLPWRHAQKSTIAQPSLHIGEEMVGTPYMHL